VTRSLPPSPVSRPGGSSGTPRPGRPRTRRTSNDCRRSSGPSPLRSRTPSTALRTTIRAGSGSASPSPGPSSPTSSPGRSPCPRSGCRLTWTSARWPPPERPHRGLAGRPAGRGLARAAGAAPRVRGVPPLVPAPPRGGGERTRCAPHGRGPDRGGALVPAQAARSRPGGTGAGRVQSRRAAERPAPLPGAGGAGDPREPTEPVDMGDLGPGWGVRVRRPHRREPRPRGPDRGARCPGDHGGAHRGVACRWTIPRPCGGWSPGSSTGGATRSSTTRGTSCGSFSPSVGPVCPVTYGRSRALDVLAVLPDRTDGSGTSLRGPAGVVRDVAATLGAAVPRGHSRSVAQRDEPRLSRRRAPGRRW
jgi:hypothetical protein